MSEGLILLNGTPPETEEQIGRTKRLCSLTINEIDVKLYRLRVEYHTPSQDKRLP